MSVAAGATATLMCFASSIALGAGGTDIASAPAVTYGQQQFGNTLDSPAVNGCGSGKPTKHRSWWTLPVTAGDSLTIDWESQVTPLLAVFAVGVTDFTFPDQDPVARDTVDASTHKKETKFVAPRTGSMPMEFVTDPDCIDQSSADGPYDFTAYVKHAVRLSLPKVRSVPRRGVLRVTVRNPDGGDISNAGLTVVLQIRSGKHWSGVGTATVAHSPTAVSYRIPTRLRHRRVSLRALAFGANYLREASATQRTVTR